MRDSLKKSEFWSAMILLVLHMAVFPIALSLLMAAKPDLLSASQMNFIYYALSLLLVALFLGKFLRRSFDGLLTRRQVPDELCARLGRVYRARHDSNVCAQGA